MIVKKTSAFGIVLVLSCFIVIHGDVLYWHPPNFITKQKTASQFIRAAVLVKLLLRKAAIGCLQSLQTSIKSCSAAALLQAEQWPCEPSEDFCKQIRRAIESLREQEGAREQARKNQREPEGAKESQSEPDSKPERGPE